MAAVQGPSPEPAESGDVCLHGQRSCGGNEVWSYGAETQVLLSKYVKVRESMMPYLTALAGNVTADGVPTMRPLWYEFPADPGAYVIDDQYLLGPDLLVAPVSSRGATRRRMYFPLGASWVSFWSSKDVMPPGTTKMVPAPIDIIPVYKRVRSSSH
jgi:alpha-D-xyloside xylohydrolase